MKNKTVNFYKYIEKLNESNEPDYLQEANYILEDIFSILKDNGMTFDENSKRDNIFAKNNYFGYNELTIKVTESKICLSGDEYIGEMEDFLKYAGYKIETSDINGFPNAIVIKKHPKFSIIISSEMGRGNVILSKFVKVINGDIGLFSLAENLLDGAGEEVMSQLWNGKDLIGVLFKEVDINPSLDYENQVTISFKSSKSPDNKKYLAQAKGTGNDQEGWEFDEFNEISII